MWRAGREDVGGEGAAGQPGTAGERESRKGRLDPFPVVADVLTEVFRPQLCETLKAPSAYAD